MQNYPRTEIVSVQPHQSSGLASGVENDNGDATSSTTGDDLPAYLTNYVPRPCRALIPDNAPWISRSLRIQTAINNYIAGCGVVDHPTTAAEFRAVAHRLWDASHNLDDIWDNIPEDRTPCTAVNLLVKHSYPDEVVEEAILFLIVSVWITCWVRNPCLH